MLPDNILQEPVGIQDYPSQAALVDIFLNDHTASTQIY